jgi:hypothetical protein
MLKKNSFLLGLALALGTLAFFSVEAKALILDNFSEPLIGAETVTDGTNGGGRVDSSTGLTTGVSTELDNVTRTIYAELTHVNFGAPEVQAKVAAGVFAGSISSGGDGNFGGEYAFDPADLSAGSLAVVIKILGADQGGDLTFAFEDTSGNSSSTNLILGAGAQTVVLPLNTFTKDQLTDTDFSMLKAASFGIANTTGELDITIDIIEVGEPATLGILGVGLMAIGFAAYRRREAA